MESLPAHHRELDYRSSEGLEVQLVYDTLACFAYSRVENHITGERFDAIAPEGVHARESFTHPHIYRIPREQDTISFPQIQVEAD